MFKRKYCSFSKLPLHISVIAVTTSFVFLASERANGAHRLSPREEHSSTIFFSPPATPPSKKLRTPPPSPDPRRKAGRAHKRPSVDGLDDHPVHGPAPAQGPTRDPAHAHGTQATGPERTHVAQEISTAPSEPRTEPQKGQLKSKKKPFPGLSLEGNLLATPNTPTHLFPAHAKAPHRESHQLPNLAHQLQISKQELGRGNDKKVLAGKWDSPAGQRDVAVLISHGKSDPFREADLQIKAGKGNPGVQEILGQVKENEEHAHPAIVTPLEKGSLEKHWDSTSPENILALFRTVEGIHKNGVFHGDIKPENVLVDGENRWKLADFGRGKTIQEIRDGEYSQAREDSLTLAHATTAYSSPREPEGLNSPQAQIEYAESVDFWGTGVTALQAMLKRPLSWQKYSSHHAEFDNSFDMSIEISKLSPARIEGEIDAALDQQFTKESLSARDQLVKNQLQEVLKTVLIDAPHSKPNWQATLKRELKGLDQALHPAGSPASSLHPQTDQAGP